MRKHTNPTSMQTQKSAVINISKEIMERIFVTSEWKDKKPEQLILSKKKDLSPSKCVWLDLLTFLRRFLILHLKLKAEIPVSFRPHLCTQ